MTRERDDGFLHADIDTNLYSDPKIVQLARTYRDPIKTATAVTMYHALILASWRQGERVTVDEAAPAWWLEPINGIADDLHTVGLTDIEGRIPEHAWERWFRKAYDRRENRRESGRKGGLVSPKERLSEAQAALNQTDTPSVTPSNRLTALPSASHGGVCPICGQSLTTSANATDGVRAAKKGTTVHDVHVRCFDSEAGREWRAA